MTRDGTARTFEPSAALESAIDVFWRQGFEATSVAELCRAMRLNPGSLYGTFGSKRALFLAAIRHYVDTASLEATTRITDHRSGLGGIQDYLDCVVDAILDGSLRWGCLLTNSLVELSARDPEVVRLVEVHLHRLEAAFAGALSRAAALDEIDAHDPAGLAAYLVCVVQGLNVLATTQPERSTLRAIVEATTQALGAKVRATRHTGTSLSLVGAPAAIVPGG